MAKSESESVETARKVRIDSSENAARARPKEASEIVIRTAKIPQNAYMCDSARAFRLSARGSALARFGMHRPRELPGLNRPALPRLGMKAGEGAWIAEQDRALRRA